MKPLVVIISSVLLGVTSEQTFPIVFTGTFESTLRLVLDSDGGTGKSLLMYICIFHVLSDLLLIYICKLHWTLRLVLDSDGGTEGVDVVCIEGSSTPLHALRLSFSNAYLSSKLYTLEAGLLHGYGSLSSVSPASMQYLQRSDDNNPKEYRWQGTLSDLQLVLSELSFACDRHIRRSSPDAYYARQSEKSVGSVDNQMELVSVTLYDSNDASLAYAEVTVGIRNANLAATTIHLPADPYLAFEDSLLFLSGLSVSNGRAVSAHMDLASVNMSVSHGALVLPSFDGKQQTAVVSLCAFSLSNSLATGLVFAESNASQLIFRGSYYDINKAVAGLL